MNTYILRWYKKFSFFAQNPKMHSSETMNGICYPNQTVIFYDYIESVRAALLEL